MAQCGAKTFGTRFKPIDRRKREDIIMPSEWRLRSEAQRRNVWIAVWPIAGVALILFTIGWRAAQGDFPFLGATVAASAVPAPHDDATEAADSAKDAALDRSRTEAAAFRGEVTTLSQQVHQDTIDIITANDQVALLQTELATANARRDDDYRQMADLRDQLKRICAAVLRDPPFPDASAIAACRAPAK